MTCKIIYCCAQSTKIHDVYGPIFLKATLIFQNFKIVHNADIFLTKKTSFIRCKIAFLKENSNIFHFIRSPGGMLHINPNRMYFRSIDTKNIVDIANNL